MSSISISEYSYQELAELDVALLPERETMFAAALALASSSAIGHHVAVAATATDTQVYSGHFVSAASADSASLAVAG